MNSNGFIILAKGKPWYSAGKTDNFVVDKPSPAKPAKKVRDRSSARTAQSIENQIFFNASKLHDDPYWIGILENMAYGKMPRGFKYNHSHLVYKSKGKNDMTLINQHDAAEALREVIGFIKKYTIAQSGLEKERKRKEKLLKETPPITCWNDITISETKSLFVEQFVGYLRDNHGLTEMQCLQLDSIIRQGITGGYIGNRNIKIHDGRIITIEGLSFNVHNGKFELDKSMSEPIKKISRNAVYEPIDEESQTKVKRVHHNVYYNKPNLAQFTKFIVDLQKRQDKKG